MKILTAICGLVAGLALLAAMRVTAAAGPECMVCLARDAWDALFPQTLGGALAAGAAAAASAAFFPSSLFSVPPNLPTFSEAMDPGNRVNTPSDGDIPDEGDIVYFPGQGASRVKNVSYDPDSYDSRGNPGIIVVETEFGTVRYGARPPHPR